jgi:hypothetical protein
MIEVTVLVPLRDNDGAVFPPEHHLKFEEVILRRFGGLSRLPGATEGKWIDGGKTYADRLVAYLIAVPSILDGAKLGEVISFARSHYRQEAIYVRYLGLSEVL